MDALADSCPDALLVVREGTVVLANAAAQQLLGTPDVSRLTDRDVAALLPDVVGSLSVGQLWTMAAAEPHRVHPQGVRTPEGRVFAARVRLGCLDLDGQQAVLVTIKDSSDERRLTTALLTAQQRFAAAFDASPIGMAILSEDAVVLDVNPAAAELTGRPAGELRGSLALAMAHPDDRADIRASTRAAARDGRRGVTGEWRLVRPDGAETWMHVSAARLPAPSTSVVLHLLDVTERRATESRLVHRALHDPLTDLPNRTLLMDRLEQAVNLAQRGSHGVGVLYVDLDGFKDVNDTHGHAVGDRVLSEVALRLRGVLRPADTVARIGGDEFVVVAADVSQQETDELATRLTEVLAEHRGSGPLAASIGVAHSSTTALDVQTLLSAADRAMYATKQRRKD